MIVSDLDGTVRLAPEPFATWRDSARFGWVRRISGYISCRFAKRIHPEIDAGLYLTGSPFEEYGVTRRWLAKHGMSTQLICDDSYSRWDGPRFDTDDSDQYKLRLLRASSHEVERFYENELKTVELLRSELEGVEIIHVQ